VKIESDNGTKVPACCFPRRFNSVNDIGNNRALMTLTFDDGLLLLVLVKKNSNKQQEYKKQDREESGKHSHHRRPIPHATGIRPAIRIYAAH
jgi:hypothetical protein